MLEGGRRRARTRTYGWCSRHRDCHSLYNDAKARALDFFYNDVASTPTTRMQTLLMVNAMSRRKKKSKKKSTGNVQSAADLNRRGLALARKRSSTLKLMCWATSRTKRLHYFRATSGQASGGKKEINWRTSWKADGRPDKRGDTLSIWRTIWQSRQTRERADKPVDELTNCWMSWWMIWRTCGPANELTNW